MKGSWLLYQGKNKIGNVVAYRRGGEQMLRAKAASVKNPKTSAQILHRAKFKLLSELAKALVMTINVGYKGVSDGLHSPRNRWQKKNWDLEIIQGSNPQSLEVNCEAMEVSAGGRLNPIFGTFTPTVLDGYVTVPVSSAQIVPGYLEEEDSVRVALFCPDMNASVVNDDRTPLATALNDGVSVPVPASWSGLKVYAYGFMTKASESGSLNASTSVYIGMGFLN